MAKCPLSFADMVRECVRDKCQWWCKATLESSNKSAAQEMCVVELIGLGVFVLGNILDKGGNKNG